MTLPRSLRYLAAVLGAVLVLASAAGAASRDLDRSFGDEGITLTPAGSGDAIAKAIAFQPDGKIVVAGRASSPLEPEGSDIGGVIARYRPDGTLDHSFGDGDGIVLDHFGPDGDDIRAVAIQPDGKIVVAGGGNPYTSGSYVARYESDGSRDTDFGVGGTRGVGPSADQGWFDALALQDDGKIIAAGTITNGGTDSSQAIVARLTADGDLDPTYGSGGVSRPIRANGLPVYSEAHDVVIQDGKVVIAGATTRGSTEVLRLGLGLARLDDHGALDPAFGDGGYVYDRPADDDAWWRARGLATWKGKLVVAGEKAVYTNYVGWRAKYVLARYTADGEVDPTFNAGGSLPGHIVATVGSDDNAGATGLAVDPDTGTATVTGYAYDGGVSKLLLDSYASDGSRDPDFRSFTGNIGPRMVAAGDGTNTLGSDLLLDPRGGTLVAGAAHDGDRLGLLLARYGDTPPEPNLRPVARIRGHHQVPRDTWVRFGGLRSSDTDGRIVDYAWRVDGRPLRHLGPTRWHRFAIRGPHTVTLRVRDDDGAVDFETFHVHVGSDS